MNQPHGRARQLLLTYLRPQRWRVAGLALLLLSAVGLQLLNPQIIRRFIDQASAGSPAHQLVVTALLFIGAALLAQAVTIGATYLSERVSWAATNALRGDLALHCLSLDMPFHNSRSSGELIERIDGDVNALAEFFSRLVINVLGSGLLLVGVLAALLWESWLAGLALTGFTLLAMLILHQCRHLSVGSLAADREAHAGLFGFIEERLAGLDDLRANGAGAYVMRGFYRTMRGVASRGRRAIMLNSSVWMITRVLFTVGYALALGIGAYLYGRDIITLGTVYLFFQYTELLRGPLEQISEQLKELQKASASIMRIEALFAIGPTVADTGERPLPPGALSVEIERLSFGYQPDASVLHDLSLQIAPGQVVGLLGRTGSGKTTLTRLLLRLYDPTAGAIRLGGVDLRAVPVAGLRHKIGIVTQDVQLFGASLRDNLTLFDPQIDDARIRAALETLDLGGWLCGLPDGLDTRLAPGGGGLSAGEAQLLAFARVFLHDPGLVILDEASSRLDPVTERRLERAIDRLLRGRTGIIIAHRLASVQRADTIVILDGGRICEHGVRADLASDPGSHFAHLLRTGLEQVLV